MRLPPYPIFPNIPEDKISLREIITEDIPDLIEISFYDAVQATTIQEPIDFGINEIGLNHIWAVTDKQYEQAIPLFERLGFIQVAAYKEDQIEYELSPLCTDRP